MLAALLVIILVGESAGANSQLNMFKVAPSSSHPEDRNCCGATNVTFSIGCGIAPRVNVRNIPPDVAAFGEFPWQVAVLDAYEQSFLCSGVLLSAKSVLTAARCVADVPTSDLRIRLGEWDILNEEEDPRETYRSLEIAVSKKYLHPDAELTSDRMSEFHSVSLLKLRKNVNFGHNPHVAPACLPDATLEQQQLSSLRCFVAGWSESPLRPLLRFQSLEQDAALGAAEGAGAKTTRLAAEAVTPMPCYMGSGYDSAACYATESPRQPPRRGRRSATRSRGEDEEEEVTWTRVLGKAQTRVVPRDECLTILNDASLKLEASSLCLFPALENSHPCQADVGAAVMCEMPAPPRPGGRRVKPGKEREELPTQLAVVGVVTERYSCTDTEPSSPDKGGEGDAASAGEQQKPVFATSILRVLDHICRVAGATKK